MGPGSGHVIRRHSGVRHSPFASHVIRIHCLHKHNTQIMFVHVVIWIERSSSYLLGCETPTIRYPWRHATLQRVVTLSWSRLQLVDRTRPPGTLGLPHIGWQYASGTVHDPSASHQMVVSEPAKPHLEVRRCNTEVRS